MVLYNITVSIDFDVEIEWREWMKHVHIPEVMATGMFEENRFYKLLNETPDASGATYSIQYTASDIKKLEDYLEQFAPALMQKHVERYKNKHVAFRTVLEEV